MTLNELKFFLRYIKDKGAYISYLADAMEQYTMRCEKGIIKRQKCFGNYLMSMPVKELIMFTLDWGSAKLGGNFWCENYRLFKEYYDENFEKFNKENSSNTRR